MPLSGCKTKTYQTQFLGIDCLLCDSPVALAALAFVAANHGEDPEGAAAALQLSVAAPALQWPSRELATWVQGGFGLSGGNWLVVSWPMQGKL